MKMTGNTVLVTGGGSGIGKALAVALHKAGNTVIVAGRRKDALVEVTRENPGMHWIQIDVEKPDEVKAAGQRLAAEYPKLNVLVNNAGIMKMDDAGGEIDEAVLVSTVTTNLLGPIRMASALIGHLAKQPSATVINVTSGLAFVPLAMTAIYCATKAALHSYTQSMRFRLRASNVKVVELAPPYVQTDLMGGAADPRAMPLAEYTAEAMKLLATDADEVLVERVRPLRNAAGPNEAAFFNRFNEQMLAEPHPDRKP